jgi:ribonuclease HI
MRRLDPPGRVLGYVIDFVHSIISLRNSAFVLNSSFTAASAWVVVDPSTGEVLVEGAEAIGEATNNVAEYTAIIRGLEACVPLGTRVIVHSDSELCINQLNGIYRVRTPHLRHFYERVLDLCNGFEEVEFVHVPRENECISRCDALANEVLDG